MGTDSKKSEPELLVQLERIRQACFSEASNFVQSIPNILFLIASTQPLEQKRWGASFLAEGFASPLVTLQDKLNLALKALPTVRAYFDNPDEDAAVLKSAVQIATSIYPLIFRHIAYNANDNQTWESMAAIKSSILRRMDSWPSGVRVCCVKFLQRIVQVQTHGVIADPRRPDLNEVSLALVHNHVLLDSKLLEAEASGLLDRLLNVFHEAKADPLFVSATLNCLSTLVRSRPPVAQRIINTVMSFNPAQHLSGPLSSRSKLIVRSMEKTVNRFLSTLSKSSTSSQFQQRVDEHLIHLRAARQAALDGTRKRPASPSADQLTNANKRPKVPTPTDHQFPPLPDGPVTLAQLFTLSTDPNAPNFDAQSVPQDIVLRCIEPLLRAVPQQKFDDAINAVRERWLSRGSSAMPGAFAQQTVDSEGALTRAALNEADDVPGADEVGPEPAKPFYLPEAEEWSAAEWDDEATYRVDRMMDSLRRWPDKETPVAEKLPHALIGRPLGLLRKDRDSTAAFILRTQLRLWIGACKAPFTTYSSSDSKRKVLIPVYLREELLRYFLENFRSRIGIAILWAVFEWNLLADYTAAGDDVSSVLGQQYELWVGRMMEGMMPYIDGKDWKPLGRFYNEIPALSRDTAFRLAKLAQDPDRVGLVLKVVRFLLTIRPPAVELMLDVAVELYRNNPPARTGAAEILYPRRPEALDEADRESIEKSKAEKAAADGKQWPPPEKPAKTPAPPMAEEELAVWDQAVPPLLALQGKLLTL